MLPQPLLTSRQVLWHTVTGRFALLLTPGQESYPLNFTLALKIHGSPTQSRKMQHIDHTIVTSVLTGALTGYLRLLSLEQNLLESLQPRKGKSVETPSDLARTEYYLARTAATESCLQLVERITPIVNRWIAGGGTVDDGRAAEGEVIDGGVGDKYVIYLNGETLPTPEFNFGVMWSEEEDEEPYIDPWTAQWITPVTSKTAGPSNTQGQYKDTGGSDGGGSVDYGFDVSHVRVGMTEVNNIQMPCRFNFGQRPS
jgi:hypothetical protein